MTGVAFVRALNALCLDLPTIAEELSVSLGVLDGYRLGSDVPSVAMRRSLIDLLKRHEASLECAASALHEETMRCYQPDGDVGNDRRAQRGGG